MRTARRETTFRSIGCSLKSDEFVAMRKLRRESEIEWKRSKGQSVGPSQVERERRASFFWCCLDLGTYIAIGMMVKNFLLLVNWLPSSICSQKVRWSYFPWS